MYFLKFKAGRLHIFSTLEFKWHLLHSLFVCSVLNLLSFLAINVLPKYYIWYYTLPINHKNILFLCFIQQNITAESVIYDHYVAFNIAFSLFFSTAIDVLYSMWWKKTFFLFSFWMTSPYIPNVYSFFSYYLFFSTYLIIWHVV